MDRQVWPYRHRVQEAMRLLRGQWTIAVLATLVGGEMQFKDLRPAINGIEDSVESSTRQRQLTDRVLADTLQRMHADGLVDRHAERGAFGPVWYSLTAKGRSLLVAIRPLAEWAQQYPPEASSDPANAYRRRRR
jgi:DNA-binding HxlR family transcriptional regulator